MWDVIIWQDENAIDYVPSSWANSDKTAYKYPLSSETKIRSLIYDCHDLQDKFKWYGATLKRGNIKSLEKAKEVCEKGKFTSNLETSDNEEATQNSFNKRKRKLTRKVLEQRAYQTDNDSQDTENSNNEDSENDDNDRPVFKIPPKKPARAPIIIPTNTDDKDNENQNDTSRNINGGSSGSSLCSTLTNYSGPNFPENYVAQLLKNQAEISFELKCIRKKIEKMEHSYLLTTGSIPHQESSVFVDKLPCNTLRELDEIETLIDEDNAKFNELVSLLYLTGGETVHKSIYAIIKRLLTNDLALKFSGQGKKRKRPFCKLNIHKALTCAIRKRHSTASDDEIKKNVSLYLAQTKSRINAQAKQIQNNGDDN